MIRFTALLVCASLYGADEYFEKNVAPILAANCMPCHDAKTRSSGFSVASMEEVISGGSRRGAGIVPGKPEESVLVQALNGKISPRMPFGKPPLNSAQMDVIAKWIASVSPQEAKARAPQTVWWAYQKPHKPAVPEVGDGWARSDIDRFVFAKLAEKHLTPSPEADPAMLLRRAYFDLIGLPPSPEETEAFLGNRSADAYEKLVDRLLADPRFGERWGRHWLDLARYADTQGFEADRENYHMWRYRDYVIRSFNADKPYDQFVKEQIAGDEMPQSWPDALLATGFLRLGPRFQNTNAQMLRQMTLDEITATVGSVFLGMTIKCAQCHDHKYDPIPQRDFYRMEAFFAPMEMTEQKVEFSDGAEKTRMESLHADCARRLQAAQERFDACQKELLAKLAASGEKPKPAASSRLIFAFNIGNEGEGFVRKLTPEVALLESHLTTSIANGVVPKVDDKLFTPEEKRNYLELLSFVDGTRGGRDMGVLQRELRRYEPGAHVVRNMANDANRPAIPVAFVRIRGEFTQPGEWVQPGYPTALGAKPEPAELPADTFGNVRAWRTPLANWIAGPANPLTARVMVNRIWQHLFGTALVATPSDFGHNGARPANQMLLDWLAVRFVERNWSVKSVIREIMLSNTYRQASLRASDAAEKIDPENTLLWRQNRKRVEGDVLRDAVLQASGQLNPESGGPGAMPRLPDAIKDRMTIKNLPSWTPSDGPETRKRSVYIFQRRQLEIPFLSVMDAPVFQSSCERRAVSTTALQALTLLNDDFVSREVKYFAGRVRREAGDDRNRQIDRAFRVVFARPPDVEEMKKARALVESDPEGIAALCRILLNANEFVYVD